MDHSPGFLALVEDALTRIEEMTVEQVRQHREAGTSFILVDVREESEWDAAHAEDSIHMGKGIIERDIEKKIPEKDAVIVLYCGGGYRSALAADALQRMGYQTVYSLAGGWRAWNAAEMPVESGSDS